MRKLSILAIVLMSMLSCATIPAPEPFTGLLAIHMDADNDSDSRWIVRYRLDLGNASEFVYLTPRNGVLYTRVPVGQYNNISVTNLPLNPTVDTAEPWVLRGRVEIFEGQVTVLPYTFIARQWSESRWTYQNLDFKPISRSEYRTIMEDVERRDTEGLWKTRPQQF